MFTIKPDTQLTLLDTGETSAPTIGLYFDSREAFSIRCRRAQTEEPVNLSGTEIRDWIQSLTGVGNIVGIQFRRLSIGARLGILVKRLDREGYQLRIFRVRGACRQQPEIGWHNDENRTFPLECFRWDGFSEPAPPQESAPMPAPPPMRENTALRDFYAHRVSTFAATSQSGLRIIEGIETGNYNQLTDIAAPAIEGSLTTYDQTIATDSPILISEKSAFFRLEGYRGRIPGNNYPVCLVTVNRGTVNVFSLWRAGGTQLSGIHPECPASWCESAQSIISTRHGAAFILINPAPSAEPQRTIPRPIIPAASEIHFPADNAYQVVGTFTAAGNTSALWSALETGHTAICETVTRIMTGVSTPIADRETHSEWPKRNPVLAVGTFRNATHQGVEFSGAVVMRSRTEGYVIRVIGNFTHAIHINPDHGVFVRVDPPTLEHLPGWPTVKGSNGWHKAISTQLRTATFTILTNLSGEQATGTLRKLASMGPLLWFHRHFASANTLMTDSSFSITYPRAHQVTLETPRFATVGRFVILYGLAIGLPYLRIYYSKQPKESPSVEIPVDLLAIETVVPKAKDTVLASILKRPSMGKVFRDFASSQGFVRMRQGTQIRNLDCAEKARKFLAAQRAERRVKLQPPSPKTPIQRVLSAEALQGSLYTVEIECYLPSNVSPETTVSKLSVCGSDGSLRPPTGYVAHEIKRTAIIKDVGKPEAGIVRDLEKLIGLGVVFNHKCGLHVHVDVRNVPQPTVISAYDHLCGMYPFLFRLIPPSRVHSQYCRRINNGPHGGDSHNRYAAVNFYAFSKYKTLEFRLQGPMSKANGKPRIDWANQVTMWAHTCVALVRICSQPNFTAPRKWSTFLDRLPPVIREWVAARADAMAKLNTEIDNKTGEYVWDDETPAPSSVSIPSVLHPAPFMIPADE